MNDLYDVELKKIAPESIKGDKAVSALCTAIDEKLREISVATRLALLLPRLDELPETIVDELAWQYHVDFYEPGADIEVKRNLVRKAIAQHRRKGTPAAVEEVCRVVFQSAKVYENWEYGGKPYHFQVRMIENELPDTSVLERLARAINEMKNVRSWVDGLSFYRKLESSLFIGGAVSTHVSYNLYPYTLRQGEVDGHKRIAGGVYIHRKVVI